MAGLSLAGGSGWLVEQWHTGVALITADTSISCTSAPFTFLYTVGWTSCIFGVAGAVEKEFSRFLDPYRMSPMLIITP